MTIQSKLLVGAVLAAALLAGCGGGGGDGSTAQAGGSGGVATGPMPTAIAQLIAFMQNIIDTVAENGVQIDVNALTLATDETVSPSPLP